MLFVLFFTLAQQIAHVVQSLGVANVAFFRAQRDVKLAKRQKTEPKVAVAEANVALQEKSALQRSIDELGRKLREANDQLKLSPSRFAENQDGGAET